MPLKNLSEAFRWMETIFEVLVTRRCVPDSSLPRPPTPSHCPFPTRILNSNAMCCQSDGWQTRANGCFPWQPGAGETVGKAFPPFLEVFVVSSKLDDNGGFIDEAADEAIVIEPRRHNHDLQKRRQAFPTASPAPGCQEKCEIALACHPSF